ncbi:hypothetical protein [Streptomyces iranensis]|uniref:hypothetical protein n=1 Tax=Streptomyces iranensis TaxID=576784 RepID=UPI0039B78A7B
MTPNPDEFLTVAFRAWTEERDKPPKVTKNYPPRRVLVIDTETRTDTSQALTFGFARLARIRWKSHPDGSYTYVTHYVEAEVMFYADDLSETYPAGYTLLAQYAESRGIQAVSRSEFVSDYVWRYCIARKNRKGNLAGDATLVGFNLPFDLSRLAYTYGGARNGHSGGFSFTVFPFVEPCETGCKRRHVHITAQEENRFRPRLKIKHMDSKKSLINWGTIQGAKPDRVISEKRGQFLDLRQLIWGMTNLATPLARACEMFGLPEEFRKSEAETHGVITPQYIAYARQDVNATTELCVKVLAEYMRHPIDLQASKVFSPASIAKGYLRKMGVTPMLDRPGIPSDPATMGHCVSTFYGGRAEAHIRRTVVPVTVCDFTSMYPTVNTLMKLWDHVTAGSLSVDESDEERRRFRRFAQEVADSGVSPLLNRDVWPSLTGFARVVPQGDILPVRAHYGTEAYNVGINEFWSVTPVWYTMADVLASCLLTGKVPQIDKVMRFIPGGEKVDSLSAVKLGGTIHIDPSRDDFFKTAVERRAAVKSTGRGGPEAKRTADFLKVLANSGSYGIYVEVLRDDDLKPKEVSAYSIYDKPWQCRPNAVEKAREFCYPPIGAVITGAARLMLAIVEKLVTHAGGTWLFCDTDSMAIVTTNNGGPVPCPGGSHRMPDGSPAVMALSREQVRHIRETINRLNPYDRSRVPELLKDETGRTNTDYQVYGYAISAKRYSLFTYDDGKPVVPERIDGKDAYMKHGLGLYLNPADMSRPEQRDWMRQTWQWIVDKAHGIDRGYPAWAESPALVRVTVSSPHVMNAFREWNEDKPYSEAVKPFNFVLLATEQQQRYDQPKRASMRLLAPFSDDPAAWMVGEWRNLRDPDAPAVNISTRKDDTGRVRVKNLRNVLYEYVHHPEYKAATPDGQPCTPFYAGLLFRRTVRVETITHIGKESNSIDKRINQSMTDLDDFTEYRKNEREIIRHAFGGKSSREVSRLVNEWSDSIREKIVRNHPYGTRISSKDRRTRERAERKLMEIGEHAGYFQRFGAPVTMNQKMVLRYFNGSSIRDTDQEQAIIMTAARQVASTVGIDPELVEFTKTPGRTRPKMVLAIWREAGMPPTDTGKTGRKG